MLSTKKLQQASEALTKKLASEMERYLESIRDDAVGEEEEGGGFPEWIAFGVVALAMALGIITRTTLAKWLP